MMPYADPTDLVAESDTLPVIRTLIDHKGAMAVVALAVAVLGLAAVWLFVEPQYEVSATIHVAPVVRPILFHDEDPSAGRNYQRYVGTEAANLLRPALVEMALDAPSVRDSPWLTESPDPVVDVLRRLHVEPVKRTELVRASMTGSDPETMVRIVNALIDAYLRRRGQQRREWDGQVLSSLREQERELEAKLDVKARQLQQTAVDKGLGAAQQAGNNIENRIDEVQRSLANERQQRALLEGRLAVTPSSAERIPALEAFFASDSPLQMIRQQLRQAENAVQEDHRIGRGSSHPDVRARAAYRTELAGQAAAREALLAERFDASREGRWQGLLRETQAKIALWEQELDELKGLQSGVAEQLFVLDNLRHERTRLEEALQRVREKIWTVEVEQNREARITRDSPARVPTMPNKDRRWQYSAAVLAMSCVGGAFTALIRGRMDRRFRYPNEVSRLGMRVLGSVQDVGKDGIAETEFDERILEPIRGISTALLAAPSDRAPRTVRLITSPTPGSGKSSMAIHLARSLAATGRKVLLIDADNQVRGITRRLHMNDCSGLLEFLTGACAASDVVQRAVAAGLDVVPSGAQHARFGDVLNSTSAKNEIRSLAGGYDEVILDSPPVLLKSDTTILAALADEVVLVLRSGASTSEEARAARRQIESVGADVVGVIFNGAEPRHARMGYGYAYAGADG